jgi:hypothetical protein
MIFDTIVFLLVARKAYIHYQTLPDKSWRGGNASLMGVLVRDSVLYFFWYVIHPPVPSLLSAFARS